MHQDQTPVSDLNLSARTVEILHAHDVLHHGTLCCVTLGDLQKWGLEKAEIGQVVEAIKNK